MTITHLEMAHSEITQAKHFLVYQFIHQQNYIFDLHTVVKGHSGGDGLFGFARQGYYFVSDFGYDIVGCVCATYL
jgi:hypothetical protein